MTERPSSDIAFSPTVKAIQDTRGSRASYARMEAKGGWSTTVTRDLASFLATTRSFYLATANADGQPYIQHRGGPAGFLHTIDEHTLAFADFAGNRQYITTGNLVDNSKAHIFIMDYAQQRRVKLWGRARTVGDDPELVARLFPKGYEARPIQAVVFDLEAWDLNCPSHIPLMFHGDDVAETIVRFQRRIDELEATIARLTGTEPAASS